MELKTEGTKQLEPPTLIKVGQRANFVFTISVFPGLSLNTLLNCSKRESMSLCTLCGDIVILGLSSSFAHLLTQIVY